MTSEEERSGWKAVQLGDVVELTTGFPFKSAEFTAPLTDVRLLRGDNIGQGQLRWNGAKRWPASRCSEYSGYELEAGDVVLAMDRPWIEAGLKYAVVQPADLPSLLVQRVARLRAAGPLDQEFLRCVVADPRFTIHIKAVQTGTAVPHISGTQIQEYKFLLPKKDDQRRIAWVLGSLDDKIENNRRIAETLERIAECLFRARFVSFAGCDDLVESELGPIPRGWRVGALAEIAKVTMGQSPPSSTYSDDPASGPVMIQGKGSFGLRFPKREVFSRAPTRLAEPGDLLMTVRAPVGDLNVCSETTCLGRGVAGIASSHPAFIEWALTAAKDRWRAHEGGTIYSSVTKKQVEQFPVIIPADGALDGFETAVAPMRERLSLCYREMASLGGLRDVLLPRLVSGNLRVAPGEGLPTEAT